MAKRCLRKHCELTPLITLAEVIKGALSCRDLLSQGGYWEGKPYLIFRYCLPCLHKGLATFIP